MARIALITGGVSGIGAATAKSLLLHGYRVVVAYHRNEIEAEGFYEQTGIPVYDWDVADYDATQTGIGLVTRDVGPFDVLINNAGVTRDAALHKMTLEQWHDVINIDLNGCFNTCRAVIGGMRERRFGRIVNVSSVNALSGQFGQTNYAAAKAGLIGFTKALALESASHGITVNAIAPGYTDTSLVRAVSPEILAAIVGSVPVGRLATPDEIARGIGFLASDDAGFITGTTLSINGGRYMA
jgi:acetoacetyl-CoA reductase